MSPQPPPADSMPYYRGLNIELLELVPLTARRVLEVGCGEGALGRAYRHRNPEVCYVGVELFEPAARRAATRLSHVVVGDIMADATLAALDAWREGQPFDALVFGDVLEHLLDPWTVLASLVERLAPGGICVVCVPNVAHWSIVAQQLRGRWDYVDSGLLDRTHIRFFTRATAVEMCQGAGLQLVDATPKVIFPEHTREVIAALTPGAATIGLKPEAVTEELSAFQWFIRSVKGPPPARLTIVGLGQRKAAGLTDARVDHPLRALASLPETRVSWDSPTIRMPRDAPPGIFVLHRQSLVDPRFRAHLDNLAAAGWVLVLDWDDDPRARPPVVDSDYLCFRYVHAVSVSTEPLAALARQWNPTVAVLPNAVMAAVVPPDGPKRPPALRVFFGALGRTADWAAAEPGIVEAGRILGDSVRFVFLHDRAAFDAFPLSNKDFHPTLPVDDYLMLLGSCDVALLPLADTPANRLKSDLRLIEACTESVVPVCSPTVYADRPEHREIALFAETAEDWCRHLVALCSDPALLQVRRSRGLDYVTRERLQSHQIAARLGWYRELVAARDALEQARRARLAAAGI